MAEDNESVESGGQALEVARKRSGNKKKKPAKNKPSKKKTGSARSVETFYKNSYRTQLSLTALADTKANIMISVNGLIVTGSIAAQGALAGRTESFVTIMPVLVIAVCVASMMFAIMAARPVQHNVYGIKDQLRRGENNLLYFNNIILFDEAEYEEAVAELMGDTELTYRQMSRHMYNLAKVLSRKYQLLRLSYSIFLGGISLVAITSLLLTIL